jgi:hypothetical protein
MIMQGIPIANAWQTPPGASLCFCPLCGIRQARPSKRTVYAWQSLCITLGYFAVCSPCVSWQSLGYGEGYTKVRSEGTSHGNAQAGKGCPEHPVEDMSLLSRGLSHIHACTVLLGPPLGYLPLTLRGCVCYNYCSGKFPWQSQGTHTSFLKV